MRITMPAPARVLIGGLLAVGMLAAAPGCSSSTSAGSGAAGEAGSNDGEAGTSDGGAAGSSDAVTWCAAYKVVNCVCQQCHQNPPLNGAPIPLLTYADTQAPFPDKTSDKKVWQEMQLDVANGSMPVTSIPSVMPPVKPLTDEQKNTLLTWLAQGATDEGGQDCSNTCDWGK